MSLAIDPIRVTGVRELQAALRAIDGESQKQLRLVFNAAADVVVKTAQPKMAAVTGAARASIKATSSQREARVSEGSVKAPYAAWWDYGGRVGRHHKTVRPFVKGGRVVYPAYAQTKHDVVTLLEQGMAALIAAAGLSE